jgi:hypothetical protein
VIAGALTNTTKIGAVNHAAGKKLAVSGSSNIMEMNDARCEEGAQAMPL